MAENNSGNSQENNSETRYFQYLTTERRGDIVEYDGIEVEDDEVFVKFKDGSRCKEDFILPLGEKNAKGNTVMAEIEGPKNRWQFEEKWVGRQEERWEKDADGKLQCVQPHVPGRKKVKLIPPKKNSKPKKSKFGGEIVYISENDKSQQQPQQQDQQQVQQDEQQVQKQSQKSEPAPSQQAQQYPQDPVWLMMDKAKKYDTDIPVSLTISLPTKSLYNVAKESFDNGGKKVVEYIISNIDDNKLKQDLKDALYEAYEDSESNYDEEPEEQEQEYNEEDENNYVEDEVKQVNTKELETQESNTESESQQRPMKEGPVKRNVKKEVPRRKKAPSPPPTKPQDEEKQKESEESNDDAPDGTTLFEPEAEVAQYQSAPQVKEENNE